jgi:hypothetical protein
VGRLAIILGVTAALGSFAACSKGLVEGEGHDGGVTHLEAGMDSGAVVEDSGEEAVEQDTGIVIVPCDPTSCAMGCCTSAGCVSGTDPTACGVGGGTCADCPNTFVDGMPQLGCVNQQCTSGACSQCVGCCSNGTCMAGQASTACGTGGGDCANCSDMGQQCIAGLCH